MKKGRTTHFFYSTIVTAIYQFIIMISGFIVPRVMLVAYGSELNGLVSSINQFISYFSLVEAGLAAAIVYSLYEPLATRNLDKINRILSAAKKYYYQCGYIFTFLVIILAATYPLFNNTKQLSYIQIFILVIALGAKSFFDFFTLAKYRVLLTADQKVYIISAASIVYQIIYILIISILAFFRVSIVLVYLFAIIAVYSRTVILKTYVCRKYSEIRYDLEPDKSALDKRWDALYQQMLGATQSSVPVVLATFFCSLSLVSVYTIYNMVMSGINGIMSIFISGLGASFGDVLAKKEQNTLERSYNLFVFVYSCINTFVYSVTTVLIVDFVKIYTSDIHDQNYIFPVLGVLMALNGYLYNMKTPQGMLIGSAGHYKETRVQCTIQVLIIIIGGLILTPLYKLTGIMIASCLSNIYRCIDLIYYVPHNILNVKSTYTFKNVCLSLMGYIIIISVGFLFVKVAVVDITSWIIKALIVSIISIGIIGITAVAFYKNELKQSIKVIKRFIKEIRC